MATWLGVALVAAAVNAAVRWLGIEDVALMLKPTVVAALAVGLALRARRPSTWLVTVGLALSAVADVAIEVSFLAGVAVFFFAHIAYLVAFVLDEPRPRLGRAVPFVAVMLGTGVFFVPAAGSLGPAIALYTLAIGAMGWRAAARHAPERAGSTLLLVGVLLFMLSDSLLAVNRFLVPLPAATALVLSTYWGGQALIAWAMSRS